MHVSGWQAHGIRQSGGRPGRPTEDGAGRLRQKRAAESFHKDRGLSGVRRSVPGGRQSAARGENAAGERKSGGRAAKAERRAKQADEAAERRRR